MRTLQVSLDAGNRSAEKMGNWAIFLPFGG
jgi:hypothetical protein